MKIRVPSASVVLSTGAIVIALGGGSYAAASSLGSTQQIKQVVAHSTAGNSKRLGGHMPNYYLPFRNLATSHGVHFLNAGQTVVLGRTGHFTFSSTCSKDSSGQNQITFDVTANQTADLDGGGPVPAGTKVNIHTDSDALNSTPTAPLKPGDFTQVGSASSSTEIAASGQEVDVFYNDGVNWPAGNGSSAHDCFAGYTGLLG
jgi:hypothetical protein